MRIDYRLAVLTRWGDFKESVAQLVEAEEAEKKGSDARSGREIDFFRV